MANSALNQLPLLTLNNIIAALLTINESVAPYRIEANDALLQESQTLHQNGLDKAINLLAIPADNLSGVDQEFQKS